MRLHIIVRETAAAAWAASDELISHVTDEAIEAAQTFARMDSVGQQRMGKLYRGRRDDLLEASKRRARLPACALISGIAIVSQSIAFKMGPMAKMPPEIAPLLSIKAPALVVSIPRNKES